MNIKKLTSKDIETMNYNELIGLVKETNRPPGGINSIIEALKTTFMNKESKILEIGTSTGFTALEISRLIGAKIIAIDINELSLKECRIRAKKLNLSNIEFIKADAQNLNFDDESFDMVFCGNVTSLIDNRKKALSEYIRVIKNGKYLVAIPMYYIKRPHKKLLNEVRNAIKINIQVHDKEYWIKFFSNPKLEILKTIDFKFDHINNKIIKTFADNILKRKHLNELNPDARKILNKRYRHFIELFRDNLSHMGYSILILRKTNEKLDEELFTSTKISN